ncbi:ABC transporter ATP-binding protein [Candidatus Kuenenbacteria bacterium]|nr:ABC transporter ATP-binding protein [Candidatus Kuenenbacteria bacterium]
MILRTIFNQERRKYFQKAWAFIKKYRLFCLVILVLSVATSVFDGFSMGAIAPFFQNLLNGDGKQNYILPIFKDLQLKLFAEPQATAILKILVFALVMIILKNLFNYLRTIYIVKVSNLIKRDLQSEMFNAIADTSYDFYGGMKSGGLIGSISVYTNGIVGFYFVLLDLLVRISKSGVYLFILVLISWKATIIFIILEIALSPVVKKIFGIIKSVSMQTTVAVADLHDRMVEIFNNIRLIKISSAENYEKERFDKITTDLARLEFDNAKYDNSITPIAETVLMLAIILFFIVGIEFFKIDLIVFLPAIVAYLYVFMKIFDEINAILRSFSKIFQYIEPYKAYEKMLATAREAILPNGQKQFQTLKKGIEFKNVSYGYYKGQTVVQDINLFIPKGKFIALVGPSGVGKTTLANLVVGLFYPKEGQILIDDVDIQELDIHSWRKKIGYISQDITIFNNSVEYNIAYGDLAAPKEKIIEAAKAANIYDDIMNLPKNLQTFLGEKGAKLSGGQRQRIAIARAILRDPEILILDEATSSLDIETEQIIQKELLAIMKSRTVIAIAHRLPTIKMADQIVVLNHGKIVEVGNHAELLKTGEFYKKYYEQQFED